MSTATLQETAFHRSRGCGMPVHIQHILHILYIAQNKSRTGPTLCGKARFEITYFKTFFPIFPIFHICLGGVHIIIFCKLFLHIFHTGRMVAYEKGVCSYSKEGEHIMHIMHICHIMFDAPYLTYSTYYAYAAN